MKLSHYARQVGISYKTAYRWWKAGQLNGYQLPSGTIVISAEKPLNQVNITQENIVCIYARVDSSQERDKLSLQAQRLTDYAIAKGYRVHKTYQEIASGENDCRKLLEQALNDNDYHILLVESEDRLALNGINYIKILLDKTGKKLELLNRYSR